MKVLSEEVRLTCSEGSWVRSALSLLYIKYDEIETTRSNTQRWRVTLQVRVTYNKWVSVGKSLIK